MVQAGIARSIQFREKVCIAEIRPRFAVGTLLVFYKPVQAVISQAGNKVPDLMILYFYPSFYFPTVLELVLECFLRIAG
jgi:hypothetical protein